MRPTEFYRLRDDRTSRIVKGSDYQQLQVRLVADLETVSSLSGQVQLLLAANMLSRWCRRIEFGFPNARLLPGLSALAQETLYARIEAETAEADPFGNFQFREKRSLETEFTLKIGSSPLDDEKVDFTVDASGWRVYAGIGPHSFNYAYQVFNLASATFAACVGVADAFKVAIGLPDRLRVHNIAFSIFDFSVSKQTSPEMESGAEVPTVIDIGNTHIVGIGSVGSAVIYLLKMLEVNGNLVLIDHDKVKILNLNRSPLFGISDRGKSKVIVASEYLGGGFNAKPFVGRYDKFIEKHGRQAGKVDLMIPLANEFGVRRSIEHNFPPLQVYGTTTIDWGLNYHRNIPQREDCSVCRFPGEEETLPPMICSQTQLPTPQGEQVDAALPFVSVATAAFVIADLLKLQMPGYPFTPNFAFIDLKGPLEFINAYDKQPRRGCVCSHRSTNIHARSIGSTRYSRLAFS